MAHVCVFVFSDPATATISSLPWTPNVFGEFRCNLLSAVCNLLSRLSKSHICFNYMMYDIYRAIRNLGVNQHIRKYFTFLLQAYFIMNCEISNNV